MSDLEEARKMLSLAVQDLEALQGMLQQGGQLFSDVVFGFHAQQAVEKGLKAWLASKGVVYPLTHNLTMLLGRLEAVGVDTEPLHDLSNLNVFAVQQRYGMAMDSQEPINRSEMYQRVTGVMDQVRDAVG